MHEIEQVRPTIFSEGPLEQVFNVAGYLKPGFVHELDPEQIELHLDVNTKGDTSPAAGLKANIDALRALPRALRLRGLGGQIVIEVDSLVLQWRKISSIVPETSPPSIWAQRM